MHNESFTYLVICLHRFPVQYLTYHLQIRFCGPWLILKHFKVLIQVINRRYSLSQTPKHLSSTPTRFNELSFLKKYFYQCLVLLLLIKKISKGNSCRYVNYLLKSAHLKQHTDQKRNHQEKLSRINTIICAFSSMRTTALQFIYLNLSKILWFQAAF